MRVLLINPPAFNEVNTLVGKEITENSGFQPPLGLLYVASFLNEYSDHEVRVVDTQVERLGYESIESLVSEWGPDIVGMTAMSFTMVDVLLTARTVKKVDPSILVCLGGPHVNIYPGETAALPDVDYAVMGEGEAPFFHLVEQLSNGQELDTVPGLVFYDRAGELRMNPALSSSYTVDLLPYPDRRLLPYKAYYSIMTANTPVGTLITAKGCPYMCTFCGERGQQARWRSGESVAEEISQCKDLGINEMFFVDDTFYVKREKAMSIAQALIDRDIRMPWGARARVNNLDREMLEKFKESGCQRLHIGVEAGTDRVLANIRKEITVEQAKRAFALCREVGINTMAYFIIGNPGETLDDVKVTIDLACELNPTLAQFSRMTPQPATALYEQGIESGILPNDYWREFAEDPLGAIERGFQPLVWTENFSAEKLFALADYATSKFYFRPRYILRSIGSVRSWTDVRRKAKAAIYIAKGTLPSTIRLQKLT